MIGGTFECLSRKSLEAPIRMWKTCEIRDLRSAKHLSRRWTTSTSNGCIGLRLRTRERHSRYLVFYWMLIVLRGAGESAELTNCHSSYTRYLSTHRFKDVLSLLFPEQNHSSFFSCLKQTSNQTNKRQPCRERLIVWLVNLGIFHFKKSTRVLRKELYALDIFAGNIQSNANN